MSGKLRGWHGRVLEVDLTNQEINVSLLSRELAVAYLGGRGVGARFLYDRVGPAVKPLAPENELIFTVGPLTATRTPTAGRTSLTTKSPLTGTILDSNAGGQWGAKLKRAGYDGLIIRGRAPHPVYLTVTSESAAIKPATALWGSDTKETAAWLRQTAGQGASAVVIGPAGENLVKFASISVDGRRSFGRGGVGAVMGSKNLKGIVVNGGQETTVADQVQFEFVLYEAAKQLKAHPITAQGLPRFGTAVLINVMNQVGALPAWNFRQTSFDQANLLSGEKIASDYLVRRFACYGCPIGCGRVTRVGDEIGEGPEYESIWALGVNCGLADLELVTRANHLCNRLGLDTISTGGTIACARELGEQGLLPVAQAMGQGEELLNWIHAIAYRQGLGAELAEGSRALAERYGAPGTAQQVKGMELPAYDPRAMQGQGLGFATSNRGGCHLRGNMLGPEILGSPKLLDPLVNEGKAGVLIVLQHSNAVLDSLVVCKFTAFALGEEHYARLLTAVTGEEYRAQDLQRIGERVWNLERLYNLREGFSMRDDTLPQRLLSEPALTGPAQGHVVKLETMLTEYYRFRSWDNAGVPAKEKLLQLGLVQESGVRNKQGI